MSKTKFISNEGVLVFHGDHLFTRAAHKALDNFFCSEEERLYMRMGHFAVCICEGILVVGKVYNEHTLDDPQCIIEKDSQFWEMHREDRLSQIGRVLEALSSGHPFYAELNTDIQQELIALG